MDCLAFCTASSYQMKALFDFLKNEERVTHYRDVLQIEVNTGSIFCFSFGATVFWGIPQEKCHEFLIKLQDFETGHLENMEMDEFTFSYGEVCKIVDDEIILPDQTNLTKLAISYGLAQTVKLGSFEDTTRKTFDNIKIIPHELAKQGKIPLSRREIRRKMGKLFTERTSINLHVDALDLPEFFWEYPELEPYYLMISKYLDLESRLEVLNKRLDIIHEMFEMLGNELNHQHSNRLEITIILLIVIEVTIALLRDVFRII